MAGGGDAASERGLHLLGEAGRGVGTAGNPSALPAGFWSQLPARHRTLRCGTRPPPPWEGHGHGEGSLFQGGAPRPPQREGLLPGVRPGPTRPISLFLFYPLCLLLGQDERAGKKITPSPPSKLGAGDTVRMDFSCIQGSPSWLGRPPEQ